ncbi:MAG: hypothetical protein N2572_04850 [Syntrophales bacterium]|nr:hypothetical protein [Syntrophales bacterium]
MLNSRAQLIDLIKDYLDRTYALRAAIAAGEAERVFSIIKDREEIRSIIDALKGNIGMGKKERKEIIPILLEAEELEKELAPSLNLMLEKEKTLFSNLRGYAPTPLRSNLVNIST